jgi:hypothetical protein
VFPLCAGALVVTSALSGGSCNTNRAAKLLRGYLITVNVYAAEKKAVQQLLRQDCRVAA